MRLYAPGAPVHLRSMPGGISLDIPAAPLTYDDEVLADSPIFYWKCDDETTDPNVQDTSGNNRDGILGSSLTVNEATVMPSGLRSFGFPATGGQNNTVAILDDAALSPHAGASGLMTLECWVNIDSLAAINTMFWKGGTNPQLEFGLSVLTTGAVQFAMFALGGASVATANSAGSVVTTGNSFHIVGTYDKASNFAKAYVNGSEVATTTTSGTSGDGTSTLFCGCRATASDRLLDGRASHFAMYATALSATRVAAHYAAA